MPTPSSHPSARPAPRLALVIDDHPMFCDALELTLRNSSGFPDIATAESLSGGLDILNRRGAPDLIVLDLNLPDVTGLDGLMRLKARLPDTPVIVVSSMTEAALVSAAMRAGASGYVPKHSPHAVFRTAIDTILQGGTWQPDTHVDVPQPEDGADPLSRLASLTPQQARILELICDGKLNKQIAWELSIAETTVKAHVTAIMRKLSVQSRTQAVLVAQQAKFAAILPAARI